MNFASSTRRGRRGERQHGQIIILFALAMLIILGMMALGVDGSYGLMQARRDQNAADFASIAGSKVLRDMCENRGAAPTDGQVWAAMNAVITENSADVQAGWTAKYYNSAHAPIVVPPSIQNDGNPAPANACGVSVTLNSKWHTFLAGVIGSTQLTTGAVAAASNTPASTPIASIYSLNKVASHAILAGGFGTFLVSGDMFTNSMASKGYAGCNSSTQTVPVAETNVVTTTLADGTKNQVIRADIIDAKTMSNMYVYGKIVSPNNNLGRSGCTTAKAWPLDYCFGNAPDAPGSSTLTTDAAGNPTDGPSTGFYPANAAHCSINAAVDNNFAVTMDYNEIQNDWNPQGDLLAGMADPLSSALMTPPSDTCQNGLPYKTYTAMSGIGAPADPHNLTPGIYNFPVVINQSTNFGDCLGILDPSCRNGTAVTCSTQSGLYRFPKGIQFDLTGGAQVVGYNVMFAIGNPLAIAGNVPGTTVPLPSPHFVQETSGGLPVWGNGAPCVPSGAYGLAQAPPAWPPPAGYPPSYAPYLVQDSDPGASPNYCAPAGLVPSKAVTAPVPITP